MGMRTWGTHRDWYICCTWPKSLWTFAYRTLRKSAKDGHPIDVGGERETQTRDVHSILSLPQVNRLFLFVCYQ
jgi:hypothetical protein